MVPDVAVSFLETRIASQGRVQRRLKRSLESAQAGVVPPVHLSSRPATAGGTDRNTYRWSTTIILAG